MKWTIVHVFLALLASWVPGIAVPDYGVEALRPPGYEIGVIGSGDRVLGKFVLHNTSDQELILRNVRRNCACYKIVHSVNRLQPGESTTLTFDLTFPEGKRLRNAVFYILSNDREKPLRQFVVKLSQSDDPDFAASKPNRIIFHLLDDRPDDGARVEAFSREQGALRVEKLTGANGQAKYAAEFPDGADIARFARAYLEYPSVGQRIAGETPAVHAKKGLTGGDNSNSLPACVERARWPGHLAHVQGEQARPAGLRYIHGLEARATAAPRAFREPSISGWNREGHEGHEAQQHVSPFAGLARGLVRAETICLSRENQPQDREKAWQNFVRSEQLTTTR